MGFSVSGATAILFLAMFISFGIAYSAVSNGFERVTDAKNDYDENVLDQRNTDLNITTVNYSDSGGYLSVSVNNTGSTALNVNETDLLVDGEYVTSDEYDERSVDGESTSLWLPGETLRVSVPFGSAPDRVKVVTGPGVAVTTEVEVV